MDRLAQVLVAHQRQAWVGAAGLVGIYVVLVTLGLGGDKHTQSNLAQCLAPFVATTLCWVTASLHPGRAKWTWRLFGASAASWGIGQVVWTWYELVAQAPAPFPSLADVGYLLALPLAIAGVLTFIHTPSGRIAWLRAGLEGGVVTAALLFLGWALVVGPVTGSDSDSIIDTLISLAYPLFDSFIVALWLYAMCRVSAQQRVTMLVLGLGLGSLTFADSAFGILTVLGSYETGGFTDLGWYCGYLLIGLAALRIDPEQHPTEWSERGPLARAASFIPLVPLCVDVALVLTGAADPRSDPLLWGTSVVIVMLLGLAQLVILLDNAVLTSYLEARVKQRTAELAHQAFHDNLTGLPNRVLLRERVEQALRNSRSDDEPFVSVLFFDLDGFKGINDSLGHAAGDALLTGFANRIQGVVRPGATFARLGGDEFALLIEDCSEVAHVQSMAERILASMVEPFTVADRPIVVNASIGIATSRTARSVDEILRNADVAMYEAKGAGTGMCRLYEARMHSEAVARLELEAGLRRALELNEFVLHYQPLVDLNTRQIIGLEALVRWNSPRFGLVSPDAFIPVAEETGLVVPLGKWVIQQACRDAADWYAIVGNAMPKVSINLSFKQLQQTDLVRELSTTLVTVGLPARLLGLELTESHLANNPREAAECLAAVKALGVSLSIDDFGTGYSSLSYLKQFPFDELKIDRRFVAALSDDSEDLQLVQAIVGLGGLFRLTTVAEGVETEQQCEMLRQLGCTAGQGYLFSAPVPKAAVKSLLVPELQQQ